MAVLENVFSWSKSRAEQFRECERKYFYDRYASWGGWDAAAPREARLAYILKNLKNRWAWKGETVHHVIEDTLKSLRTGKAVPFSEAESKLTEIMRRDYRSSRAKKYLNDPKRSLGLFEHEYEKKVSDEIWKRVHDEAAACLKSFFASDFYRELAADDKKNWLVIEDLEEFEVHGAKIYVKLDFARKKNGAVEIYDWKTGKEEKETGVQIGAYALFAMKKWGIPLESVKAFLVYLAGERPEPKEFKLNEALIAETEKIMAESIAGMRQLLIDPVKNVPKAREFFKFTENVQICANCNFYKLCEKYNTAASKP